MVGKSKVISGLNDWQAHRRRKDTSLASRVGPDAYQRMRDPKGTIGEAFEPTFHAGLTNNDDARTPGGHFLPATVTRATSATYVDRNGILQLAGVDESRQEYSSGQSLGTLMELASTNKCTNYNANPDEALTNIIGGGDPARIISRVLDVQKLQDAGLTRVCTSGYVLKLDNSAGTSSAFLRVSGEVTNVNTHSVFAYARNDPASAANCTVKISGAGSPGGTVQSTEYERVSATGIPSSDIQIFEFVAPAGAIGYFILNQLEEQPVPTRPIITSGTATSRAVDQLTWSLAGKPYGSELVTNPEFTTDINGWSDASDAPANISWAPGGLLSLNAVGGNAARATQAVSVTPNRWYRVQFFSEDNLNFYGGTVSTGTDLWVTTGGKQDFVVFVSSGTIHISITSAVDRTADFCHITEATPILNQSQGMGAITFRPSAGYTVQGSNNSRHLLLGETLAYPWLTHGFNNGVASLDDGTSTVSQILNYAADDLILIAWRWGSSTMAVNVKRSGTWNTWDSDAYDGSFASDQVLRMGAFLQFPAHYRDLYLWDKDKGTAWLESFFSGVAN